MWIQIIGKTIYLAKQSNFEHVLLFEQWESDYIVANSWGDKAKWIWIFA